MAAPHSPFAGCDTSRDEWVSADRHELVARLHLQLRSGPQAAGEGRHALDRLHGVLDDDRLRELRLLVTELVTNSIRHGTRPGDWITLDVDINPDAVRVVVRDRGPGFQPQPKPEPHHDRPGGWGLCLVDRLADRWGVDADAGTAVWFEMDRCRRFAAAA